ncbi:Queuine tRNA-ribosyltransferase [Arachis hypogaea]|nr:Queuine tRNA-ribosyltransferase [Arachis hypogaea]
MALDDVVKTTITGPRIEEAMYRTLRWIDRCIAGGLDPELSYAIGGLAGGDDKDSFCALGADMYDCVYPTRTARFGTALILEGVLKLKHRAMADDTRPIDPTCPCMVYKNYTRTYINCLVTKDAVESQLLSYHNLYYMMRFPKGDVLEWVCNAMEVAEIDIFLQVNA